jgi:hypothetical protein
VFELVVVTAALVVFTIMFSPRANGTLLNSVDG